MLSSTFEFAGRVECRCHRPMHHQGRSRGKYPKHSTSKRSCNPPPAPNASSGLPSSWCAAQMLQGTRSQSRMNDAVFALNKRYGVPIEYLWNEASCTTVYGMVSLCLEAFVPSLSPAIPSAPLSQPLRDHTRSIPNITCVVSCRNGLNSSHAWFASSAIATQQKAIWMRQS
jgi:hypothetical protein